MGWLRQEASQLVSPVAATDWPEKTGDLFSVITVCQLSVLQRHPEIYFLLFDDLFLLINVAFSRFYSFHSGVTPNLFLPVPPSLSTVLCKFSHKCFSFGCHPLEGVTRGGPPLLPPLVRSLAASARSHTTLDRKAYRLPNLLVTRRTKIQDKVSLRMRTIGCWFYTSVRFPRSSQIVSQVLAPPPAWWRWNVTENSAFPADILYIMHKRRSPYSPQAVCVCVCVCVCGALRQTSICPVRLVNHSLRLSIISRGQPRQDVISHRNPGVLWKARSLGQNNWGNIRKRLG